MFHAVELYFKVRTKHQFQNRVQMYCFFLDYARNMVKNR